MNGLLPYRAVARRLKKHPRTVLQWIYIGYLKGRKIGRSWYVSEADLRAFIANPPPYPGGKEKE
jgi:Helix-turn-helix domain